MYGNQTRNAVCDIFREIGFCDFPRNWSRGSSLDMSRADILSPRPRFLSPFRNNSAAPTSPQQVTRRYSRLNFRKCWKTMKNRRVKNPERLLRADRDACWAIARRTSRRFCCFRAKAIERVCLRSFSLRFTFSSLVHLLLPGSPSPTPRESAGRRCTSRLSAPLGRRAAFSHRLVVARFSAFLNTDFTLDCVALEKSPFGSGLSYRISGNR